jgi:hypothetical protein
VSAQHTPGPWFVEPCTEGPGCGMWSVARWNPVAEPGYDYESMVDAHGGEALFDSPAEARAAIAKATGSAS